MGIRTYVVGGAVRDQLLGLPVSDRDHVVVGATPEQMIAAGYKPVGQDFPVFLHPQTREEYALARTERKVAPGYAGFTFHSAPDVTLEQDLARRDLTINAMALAEDGSIIDPYGGQADLRAKLFRHVSAAFAEDPVRILRTARFAARFVDFEVAEETLALMQSMAQAGEVDALVAERVWQELARGLLQARPSRMVQLLIAAQAWARLAPEFIDSARLSDALTALDRAATAGAGLPVRFAVLVCAIADEPQLASDRLEQLCRRWRVPGDCRDLGRIALAVQAAVSADTLLSPVELLQLLEQVDAFRRPERFEQLLQVMHFSWQNDPRSSALEVLSQAHQAGAAIDTAAIALPLQQAAATDGTVRGERIKAAIHEARLTAITRARLPSEPALRVLAAASEAPVPARPHKRRPFWQRALSAPFAIVLAIALGFIDWLWNPLLALMVRLGRWSVFRVIERTVAALPPYPALLVFVVPGLLLLPFKMAGLLLMASGQKLAGMGVFLLAKVIGTALLARIFSLTSPALMRLSWFARLYGWFKLFKSRLYALVFDHPWVRWARRRARALLVAARAWLRETLWH